MTKIKKFISSLKILNSYEKLQIIIVIPLIILPFMFLSFMNIIFGILIGIYFFIIGLMTIHALANIFTVIEEFRKRY